MEVGFIDLDKITDTSEKTLEELNVIGYVGYIETESLGYTLCDKNGKYGIASIFQFAQDSNDSLIEACKEFNIKLFNKEEANSWLEDQKEIALKDHDRDVAVIAIDNKWRVIADVWSLEPDRFYTYEYK